jgi:hypothetical protein
MDMTGGVTRYFTSTSPQLWTNVADRLAVIGETSEQECPGQDEPTAFGSTWFPVTNTSCQLPANALYNPVTNPRGVRCSMKDYHINVIGVRPQDGFTSQVFDSVGLQYGLKALEAGSICRNSSSTSTKRSEGWTSTGICSPVARREM